MRSPAQTRKTIEGERDLLVAALEAADLLLVILDDQGRIRRVNHAFEVATGYRAGDLRGRDFLDALPIPEARETFTDGIRSLRAGAARFAFENHWRKSGGERLETHQAHPGKFKSDAPPPGKQLPCGGDAAGADQLTDVTLVARYQHLEIAVQAVAQARLLGQQLVSVVDEQLEVTVVARTAHARQILFAQHNARDRQGVRRVALARSTGAATVPTGEHGGHLTHFFTGGQETCAGAAPSPPEPSMPVQRGAGRGSEPAQQSAVTAGAVGEAVLGDGASRSVDGTGSEARPMRVHSDRHQLPWTSLREGQCNGKRADSHA